MPLEVGMVQASSYRDGCEPGPLVIGAFWIPEIRGRQVLLVDDIFDTGLTLDRIVHRMRAWQPASLRTAVLLRKQGRQQVDWNPDFVGFEIPDRFVVGYGLDYRHQYRNLPYVAVLEDQDLGDSPS
jgi:hypoxanthine phosphoribosyltransferase